ncbi:hypothetical protein J8273_2209 [Carpediemonas membranifera]|uniref:Uncharacterized protein n=1 Tax=Carpediemonas membranifera TaxID=201153 RepID=A0A8J6E3Q5_9EUKA|nr:hypothetical protein J8273_2209 [Carpediemonas membranifera]|eukprot:KAG9395876.1 hypothetical protein J8273_2209 [Carpediemonas membranifera]
MDGGSRVHRPCGDRDYRDGRRAGRSGVREVNVSPVSRIDLRVDVVQASRARGIAIVGNGNADTVRRGRVDGGGGAVRVNDNGADNLHGDASPRRACGHRPILAEGDDGVRGQISNAGDNKLRGGGGSLVVINDAGGWGVDLAQGVEVVEIGACLIVHKVINLAHEVSDAATPGVDDVAECIATSLCLDGVDATDQTDLPYGDGGRYNERGAIRGDKRIFCIR